MGTNYYAAILPTKERKQKLINAIQNDDIDNIQELYNISYRDIDNYNPSNYGILHLGKRSSGWKFLWDPNIYKYNGKIKTYYDFNKKSILEFLSKPNIKIIDEYWKYDNNKSEHEFTPEEFMNMAINWCPDGEDGTNSNEYIQYNNLLPELGIRQIGNYFFSDGLRFSAFTEFS